MEIIGRLVAFKKQGESGLPEIVIALKNTEDLNIHLNQYVKVKIA